LEVCPNLNATELLEQLLTEYPGRFALAQLGTLQRRLKVWRTAAAARGIVTRPLRHRSSGLPRNYRSRKDPFERHWPELCLLLEADPDQTGVELFDTLRARYPDQYTPGQLRTLQRRLQVWRRNAARLLVFHEQDHVPALGLGSIASSGIRGGAAAPPLMPDASLQAAHPSMGVSPPPVSEWSGKIVREATGKKAT
jgi:hypothetical protein